MLQESRTIQCWPGGQSFTFKGDPDGPAEKRSLRTTRYNGEPDDPWRPGTVDEWRAILRSVRAEMYASRDVFGCDSALVDDLIKASASGELSGDLAEGFSYDEIRNLYADPSGWGLERCREYLSDNGQDEPTEGNVWQMDRADLAEQLENIGIDVRDEETIETLREAVIANIDDETIDGIEDWREACRDFAQDNPAEVYEWWRVSSWMCDQLDAIGEVTIDNGYGHWWGRTCTGQGFLMDGTLQAIADRFLD